jgi:hypothetical protein
MFFRMTVFTKLLLLVLFIPFAANSQTDLDGIMMNKNQFCHAFIYEHSSWDHYWEGDFKRTNENLGTVTTQSVMYMPNYGITNNLNLMASLPYVWTKASAGTLHGMKGVQDLMLFLKWKALTTSFGKNRLSLFAVGGFSTAASNYAIDFLPMSIGLGSTNLTGRGIIDYQRNRLTVTGSASYVWRSNVTLDRDSYYDTEMHLTNEIKMPNVATYQLRAGYRGKYLIAEALLNKMNTSGGFDITKNNMPFPSNEMDATSVGASIKYTVKQFPNLALLAGGHYTIAGRNIGQLKAINAGVLYAFYVSKKPNHD